MKSYTDIEALNALQFNNLFNSSLINSLPYMFWMYELIDGEYKLIKWNKNQEIHTEYNKEELFHMSPLGFFREEDYEKIEKAISIIFTEGKVKIFENLLTKTGKVIPYCFEGYQFNFGERQIFIGVSIDVSSHEKIKNKLILSEKEINNLKTIEKKNKNKLDAFTSQLLKDSMINSRISRQIDKLLMHNNMGDCKKDIIKLKKIIESQEKDLDNWELYQLKFDKVYTGFIDELKTKHANLSLSELKLCSYIRMELPMSEIASILNISIQSVRKKKYRVRLKLKLKRSNYLEIYLSNI